MSNSSSDLTPRNESWQKDANKGLITSAVIVVGMAALMWFASWLGTEAGAARDRVTCERLAQTGEVKDVEACVRTLADHSGEPQAAYQHQ